MQYFVEVHAPMDETFVGPFDDCLSAHAYAGKLKKDHPNFDTYVMDGTQREASIAEFGDIPLQAPE